MAGNNLQEPLQAFPTVFDHIIAEPVGEDFPGEWWYCDSRALALQDIPEILKVGVSSTHNGVFELKRWDVCPADNLVRGEHITGSSVGLRIANLYKSNGGKGYSLAPGHPYI